MVHPGDGFDSFQALISQREVDANFNIDRWWKIVRKFVQNDAKPMAEIDDKSMNVRNLRFLVFCEGYNVKIVFLHDQGYQKSIKNRWKINANSMLEKGMQKNMRSVPKWRQNGSQNRETINKKSERKINAKTGVTGRRWWDGRPVGRVPLLD